MHVVVQKTGADENCKLFVNIMQNAKAAPAQADAAKGFYFFKTFLHQLRF